MKIFDKAEELQKLTIKKEEDLFLELSQEIPSI